jgi:hypothetical protein
MASAGAVAGVLQSRVTKSALVAGLFVCLVCLFDPTRLVRVFCFKDVALDGRIVSIIFAIPIISALFPLF